MLTNVITTKIGKNPVVIIPLDQWPFVERALEDYEMYNSKSFKKQIAKSRASKKWYSSSEARKMLGL
jgi:hypothetical protein